MLPRYLIIHGHFYQPPRENPWTGSIGLQASAAPFANWNQRVNRECYAPNTLSRLVEPDGRIVKLINNYAHLNFDFGPTLLNWLENEAPDTLAKLIAANDEGCKNHGGHGPALAHVYNHLIMPLANTRDKLTQIRWGLSDYQTRFGRPAEGMWLAETAIDLETARLLSQEGVKFTILSPYQAKAVRPLIGGTPNAPRDTKGAWADVTGGHIDPRRPYRLFWGLGPDDYLDIFFYDAKVSQAIAFERLLSNGPQLLNRIEAAFGLPMGSEPQLVNLATDGESYGHHFRYGDMPLAWLFDHIVSGRSKLTLTNYAEFLSLYPPRWEVQVFNNSSWSCIHGVERWRSDCGCHTGGAPGWNQQWRTPLRDGLNWLRDQLSAILEKHGPTYFTDHWAARDAYLPLVSRPEDEQTRDLFLKNQAKPGLTGQQTTEALHLMEAQLMSLYSFTSCGWFFDDLSGLEPVQNLKYALRALDLIKPFIDDDLTPEFLNFLSQAHPNNPAYSTGVEIWQKLVCPERVTTNSCAAHWAMGTLAGAPKAAAPIHWLKIVPQQEQQLIGAGLNLLVAQVEVTDIRLRHREIKACLGLYSGGPHLAILVSPREPSALAPPLDPAGLVATLDGNLSPSSALTVWDAFLKIMPDGQRFTINDMLLTARQGILEALVGDIFASVKNYAQDCFDQSQLLLVMNRDDNHSADFVEKFIFTVAGENELKRLLSSSNSSLSLNIKAIEDLANRFRPAGAPNGASFFDKRIENYLLKSFKRLNQTGGSLKQLTELVALTSLIKTENWAIDLWAAQNQWHDLFINRQFTESLTDQNRQTFNDLGKALNFII